MVPLTLLTGICGMNFKIPRWLRQEEAWVVTSAVMVVMFVGLLAYFRKRRWL
jgi:Mg2+ and Co2+ transporter CorA